MNLIDEANKKETKVSDDVMRLEERARRLKARERQLVEQVCLLANAHSFLITSSLSPLSIRYLASMVPLL